ncbi:MAG TPA: HlyD family secretion protein [Pseudosphingobacterium sp.]|nr:HlyD family secretion protein [Pseudosphingobacterium sp.]
MTTQKQSSSDKIITRTTSIVALVLMLALLYWGVKTGISYFRYEETNDAQVDEYINPITSRVSGYIQEVRFEENQAVKKGDTLVIIDNSEYATQQNEAMASLMNARAQVAVLHSNMFTANKGAEVSRSQIAAAKAKFIKQQHEFDRYQNLYDVESVTKQQLETMQSALAVAKADYEAATNSYEASLSRANDIKVQANVLEAEIKRREAILERSTLNTGYTVITAPYNGKMGRRTIQPGQLMQPGQTLAFIIDHASGKWVVANFKETQIRDMEIGKEVRIWVDAYPDRVFHGKIESLSGATGSRYSLLPPDNSTGNFVKIAQRIPVRIRLEGKGIELLRAGMNATVKVKKGA